MKEIKFRAVFKGDLEAGEPLMFYQANNKYGEYEEWNALCKFHPIVLVNEEEHIAYPLEFILADDDWIVMQYTGLKDKNGKEIYERDVVRWRDIKIAVNIENVFDVEAATIYVFHQEMEVIGNIYENPELLNITNCDDEERKKEAEAEAEMRAQAEEEAEEEREAEYREGCKQ